MVNKCANCGHNEQDHFSVETAMADGRRPCVHVEKVKNGRMICGCSNFVTDEDRFKKSVTDSVQEVTNEMIRSGMSADDAIRLMADRAWDKFIGRDE